jgi:hypothetical protein
MGDDAIQQRADHVPLALLPLLVDRQDLPAHGQETRLDQQAEIPHARAVVQRRRVAHENQASIAPQAQELAEQAGPQRHHDDLLVGQQAGQAAFAAGGLGRADADERFRHPGQPRRACQHHAQDTEGQRFAAMPVQLGQKRPQVSRPLAPQPL